MNKKGTHPELGELLESIHYLAKTLSTIIAKEGLDNELLNTQEVLNILGVTRRTLHSYRINGIIPFIKVGGKIFFKRSDLGELLNGKREVA